jgi:hypothetical protein
MAALQTKLGTGLMVRFGSQLYARVRVAVATATSVLVLLIFTLMYTSSTQANPPSWALYLGLVRLPATLSPPPPFCVRVLI